MSSDDTPQQPPKDSTPDAEHESFVDYMPPALRPWLRLMRADRPIGTWLLLLPCWWGLALGAATPLPRYSDLASLLFFTMLMAVGAFVMRAAGCIYNDIVDRDIDAKVARTANRPLASGRVSLTGAWALLVALSLIGLLVLIQFNLTAILTGLAALGLVAAYPFMKRITWWPQAWLGLTFNWGVLVGYAAVTGTLGWPAFLLWGAGIFWTLGYDTIYAHQDKEDDALIGVKSTALRLGERTQAWLVRFYTATVILAAIAGRLAGMNFWFFLLLVAPMAHFSWQIWRLKTDDPATCLKLFKSNRDAGLIMLGALLAGLF
ncbi:4-hydroxybenzoate octaprenyltransferase [Aquisalinus flavus]|uniref:4-hydroxybenzoate octaprenyltransferase n=1 Tax=Aquisalinus flavus TaxID=1526572 RepID=A0A8J2Y5M1_9PROT|nr:4-hydroxybenzoate octaprenyltransferase [Aquisalinus flavus]MBD0427244.1 4-hydroxybenzoate octaprenyltransferase [Aquisalinus flavus]UNE47058.1 4-hydroxybenzoate octaprenyltransferase [Aquisalinus flavus]GGC99463.1 4-hydroxybenzoate octaprenyltransferase [Aquisalinus flavus]